MNDSKYIHYCWFGDKPLPKLAKKCIKSWKKYLPDYQIIRWSEENVDLNECPFIKEAYDAKKWAFVADYARTKAMYEFGGIYFDTDMLIKKDISFLLDKGTFLGVEDSNMINAAVWGTNKKHSWFAKKMLDFYKSQDHFKIEDIYSMSIPRIITKILYKEGFDFRKKEVQILHKDIYVYPREYFYPLSYNYRNNVFTKNTCMVHYFDATWVSAYEKRENKIFRLLGQKNGQRFINLCRKTKRGIKKCLKIGLFPVTLTIRHKRRYGGEQKEQVEKATNKIKNCTGEYVVFHNPEWFGVTSATKELFSNTIPMKELRRTCEIKKVGNAILSNSNIKQVIFSAMSFGWNKLAIYIKNINPDIKIKVYWHGNNSQVSEPYGWQRNLEIIDLNRSGIIDVIATCKKSIIPFYKSQGIKTTFITNKVILNDKIVKNKNESDVLKIGLYAAKTDDWRKNVFAQIAAVALMDNVELDIVPLSNEALRFAGYFGLKVNGLKKPIARKDLLKRMSCNDLNLYVTLSECSPMLPLESFEVGVPCITGNNHHYFLNHELEKYLVVNNEENIEEIKKKIETTLKNKEKILKLYAEWVKENNASCDRQVKEFLEM